jgi:hypothetical protein
MRLAIFMFALLAATLTAFAGGAVAEETAPYANLSTVLPATVGAKACYTRSYDAKHLAAHPRQRVTAVTFLMRVVGIGDGGDWVLDPKGKYEKVNYQFAMSATRRGDRRLAANGYCPDAKDLFCARECDGGGVTLEKIEGADALTLKLGDGILMGPCDERKGTWLKPGADDKAFRLNKVAPAQCAALEKSEFKEVMK